MLNLLTELSLVLATAAFIGWLMGRYLCKSGEYEQRSNNKSLQKKNTFLQSQLDQREKEYQLMLQKTQEITTHNTQLEQQLVAATEKIESLTAEREEHLLRLQESAQYRSRLKTLMEDYEIEKQQRLKQKQKVINLTEQIDEWANQQNSLQKKLDATKKHCQQKERELDNTTRAYEEQAEELAHLATSAKQLQETLKRNKQLETELAQIQEEYATLQSRLQQTGNDYSKLQKRCATLSQDSLGFAKKMEALNQEKSRLNRLIETMTIEKNDYLGRLRAISSVVDVVGTEVLEAE